MQALYAIWASYETAPKGERHVHASAIQDRLNAIRELKDAIKFSSLASNLTDYESALETWCSTHQPKLETMGCRRVLTAIRREPSSIQVVVLAYFLMAVGVQAYRFSKSDLRKMFVDFPILEVYHKLVQLGMDANSRFMQDILQQIAFLHGTQALQLKSG